MGKKNKKKKLGKIIAVVILCLFAVIGIVAFKGKKAQNAAGMIVKTATISKESIESNIESSGKIISMNKEELITIIDQKVKNVVVKVGDKVKEGDILVELDTKELEYQLKKDELSLEVAKVKLDQLKKNSKADINNKFFNAEIEYNDALKVYEDKKKLKDSGVLSESELAVAKSVYEKTKSEYMMIKEKYDTSDSSSEIRILAGEVKGYELSVKKIKERIGMTVIKSPINGIITTSNAKKGMIASATSPLFIIEDLNELEVLVNISEYDISKIKLGQPVEINCDGVDDKEYIGEISYISPSAIVKQNGQGAETVVQVKAKINNQDSRLKPNFSANTVIKINKKDNVLTVPYEAVYNTKDGVKKIFIIAEDKAVGKEITYGIEGDTVIEVIGEGISEGDTIILYPTEDIVDGLNVSYDKPKNEEKKDD